MTRLRVLLLADDQKGANTIHQHIQSFTRHSRHHVERFNPRNLARSRFLDLEAFDVVVIHYSLNIIWDDYLAPWFRDRVAAYGGLKVQFIQDEYRYVDEITACMRALGVDVLFTVVPEPAASEIYATRIPDTTLVPTLTGYVPDEIVGRAVPGLNERPTDVGYRGRSLPYWLGRLGHEKVEIGRRFLALAGGTGLGCDIAWTERSRIYGSRWYDWIASCRAMLGSESGSSIVDFDGGAEQAVRRFIAANPLASFDEVESAVLRPYESGPTINAISPRVFESAAMRTALVMFPGEYSGAVRPHEHYIPLAKDFSNFEEVAEKLADRTLLAELTEHAYQDLIASGRYSFRAFVGEFDAVIDEHAAPHRRSGSRPPRLLLRAEELRAGRTYGLSSLYAAARETALASFASKQVLRRPALRELGRRAVAQRRSDGKTSSLWDDVLRIALLTGVQSGDLRLVEPFTLDGAFEDERVTFTSRSGTERVRGLDASQMEAAFRAGSVRELLWNHAPVGQYLALPVPFSKRSIHLDIGRYDAYGVYRFDKLAEVALEEPDLVLAALAPLLSPSTD